MLIALSILYLSRHSSYMKYPPDYGIKSYETISIQSTSRKGKKIKLNGWWIPAIKESNKEFVDLFNKKNNQATIIVVHGHGSNISRVDRTSDSILVKGILPFYHAGFNVLAFDLRNHGKSQNSKPVSYGYYESNDILAAIDWFKIKAQNEKSLKSSLFRRLPGY